MNTRHKKSHETNSWDVQDVNLGIRFLVCPKVMSFLYTITYSAEAVSSLEFTYARTYICRLSYAQMYAHANTHARADTHTLTRTLTYAQTHTHTHTHAP